MYNFDRYNVLLAVAKIIPVLLMTLLCSRVTNMYVLLVANSGNGNCVQCVFY